MNLPTWGKFIPNFILDKKGITRIIKTLSKKVGGITTISVFQYEISKPKESCRILILLWVLILLIPYAAKVHFSAFDSSRVVVWLLHGETPMRTKTHHLKQKNVHLHFFFFFFFSNAFF